MILPNGKPLTPEETVGMITSDAGRKEFKGVVRMHGKTSDREYDVELLMANGEIMAMEVTFLGEDTLRGKKALAELKKLGGSEGELTFIRFKTGDATRNLFSDNARSLLDIKTKVLLDDLKIRIKTADTTRPSAERMYFVFD